MLLLPRLYMSPRASWLTLYMCSTLLPPATSSRCLLLHAKLNTGHPVETTCSHKHTITAAAAKLHRGCESHHRVCTCQRCHSHVAAQALSAQNDRCCVALFSPPRSRGKGELHNGARVIYRCFSLQALLLLVLTCSRLPLSVHTPMLPSMEPENSSLALVA